jgi:serine phosphatase RsbU (regulator of sigma subunit)
MNFWRKSLLLQLVTYFSILSTVTVSIVAFSAYVRSRDALQKSVIDRLQVATSLKEYQLNEWVVNQRKDVIFLTQIPNVRDDLSALLTNSTNTKSPEYIAAYTRLNKFLAQVIANKPNLSSIIANTNGGYVVFSSQVDDDLVGKFRPLGDPTTFFTQKNANTVVPNFYLSRATGKAQITFATPVFDREDTRMGAISVNLALQDIDNLIRERTGLGRTSETYLVGRAGNKSVFISREDAKSQAESKKEIVEVKSAGVDLALAKQDGYGLYTNYAGIPVVGVFRWSTSQNLAILAEINQDEAFEPANRLARDILLIGLSSAGILLLAVYLLARRITQPILAIADAANQVSRGNLSAQAPILTKDEIGILAIAFNQMTSELKSSGEQLADYSRTLEHKVEQRTYELKEAKEQAEEANKFISALLAKMSNELEKGQQMQLNFLPPEVLQVPNWEISAFFKPARQVAGDFYDTFPVLDKYVGLVIADVCDKGVGAALFMALFRSLIRIFASQTAMRNFYQTYSLDSSAKFDKLSDGNYISELTPANILEAVALTNNYVAEHHGDLGMFATLFFGVLDPQAGELYYINGGHESLFIINSEGKIKQTLNSTGPAVGMMPNMKFKVEQVHLESGDILLGYTDGVTEARALAGEFFTNQKLLDIVTKSGLSVSQLINEINQNLNNHIGEAEQFDDITLIGIQRIN